MSEASKSNGLWGKWKPRVLFLWTGLTSVLLAIVWLANNKDAVKTIYELTVAKIERPAGKAPEQLIPLVLEDGPSDPKDLAVDYENDRLGVLYGHNVSDKPKIFFEEAARGRVRILLSNNTGRKITFASSRIVNGKPNYDKEERAAKKTARGRR